MTIHAVVLINGFAVAVGVDGVGSEAAKKMYASNIFPPNSFPLNYPERFSQKLNTRHGLVMEKV